MKTKKSIFKFIVTATILALIMAGLPGAASRVRAATGPICEQYGTTTQGNYIVMNNRWGTTATQCINVTTNGFVITQQDGVGNLAGAPVSYPAIYVGCHYSNCSPSTNLPMQVSAISTANTSVTLTYPSGSHTYDAAYDIWMNPTTNVSGVQASEIMIWLNRVGSIQPIGSYSTNVSLAGRTWEVWTGSNGQNNVVSYVATPSGVTNFSADIKVFITDSFTRMSGFGNSSWYLTSAQMGFEPWIGGVGLSVNSFSLNVVGGGGATPTRTNTPGAPAFTPTRTHTPNAFTPTRTNTPNSFTPTRTPTPGSGGGTCSPVTSTITAPFDKSGAGTFCYQSNNLGANINSWGMSSLTINGVNYTNQWALTSSLPAKIGGYWYISYTGIDGNSHFVGTP